MLTLNAVNMTTCFIFAKHLSGKGCFTLSLDPQGNIEAPLAYRNIHEIQVLQHNSDTIIVAPTDQFTLHLIQLPWLPEKKARIAIPYALEDKLADNVDMLHFAFNHAYYQEGYYLITVCTKHYIGDLITKLAQYNLRFTMITLDWFALRAHEALRMENYLLVHHKDRFMGALTTELIPLYLEKLPPDLTYYSLNSDAPTIPFIPIQEDPQTWIAKRLYRHKPFNLCQGEFMQASDYTKMKHWYVAAITMSILWIGSFFITEGIKIHTLTTQTKTIDAQIAAIYQQFFPHAKHVISPKFRIEQLLKSKKNDNNNTFWLLLNHVSQAAKKHHLLIEQLRFQQQALQIMLVSKDFDALEAFQNDLQKANIKIKQTQAHTRNQQVTSVLELRL